MECIDDLSWSNIVKLIQQEEIKGADLLNTCANELEEVRKELSEHSMTANGLHIGAVGEFGKQKFLPPQHFIRCRMFD